jgi:hypothetical protein
MDYSPQRHNAVIPQPKNRDISRKGRKGLSIVISTPSAKLRVNSGEKSFSDPSHPLGMTDLALSLGFLGERLI